MPRVSVPTAISEARTDRLRVGVNMGGAKRLIVGARAPTISQGAAQGGATRTPSAYLLGERDEAGQETTIQIVMRALIGTPVFDYLDAQARANGSISLDFRTYGNVRHEFTEKSIFTIATGATVAGATGMSEISGSADPKSGFVSAELNIGDTPKKRTLVEGGVLEVVGMNSKNDGPSFRDSAFTDKATNPEKIVCADILYDSAGANPKAYASLGLTGEITAWPNDGSAVAKDNARDSKVVFRDQSVKWTADGTVDSFEPGFGEDSALYTLSVTLTDAMPKAEIIHSAEADEFNPHYGN